MSRTPSLSHSHSRSDSDSTDTLPSISFDSFAAYGIEIPESTLDSDTSFSLDGPGVGQDNDMHISSKRYSSYSSDSHHSDCFTPSPSSSPTVHRFSATSSASTSIPTLATPRISVPPIQVRSPTRTISIPLYTPSLYDGRSPTSEYSGSSTTTSAPATPDPHTPNSSSWFSGYNETPRIVFSAGLGDDEEEGELGGEAKLKLPRYTETLSEEPAEYIAPRVASVPVDVVSQPQPPAPALPTPAASAVKDHLKPLKLLQKSELFVSHLPSPYDSQMFFLPKGYRRRNQQPGKKARTIVDAALREKLRPIILVDKMVVGELKQPARRQTDPSADSDRAQQLRWHQWSTAGVIDQGGKPEFQDSIRSKWEVDSRRWINVHVAESYQWLLGTA
jgi:hypothetical protein